MTLTASDLRLVTVDAFTDRPFAGNPAAICVLDAPADEGWMQALAAEMNLSETAFLVPIEGGWNLRWFTPTVEVDLCGHATLASAHVLCTEVAGMHDELDELRFSTRSGWLSARRLPDGWIELDFPADTATPVDPLPALIDALGIEPSDAVGVLQGRSDLLVELASATAVRACAPDHRALAGLPVRGVMVTAAGSGDDAAFDFVSRFFAPGSGIDEDPVTGSAHCLLAPFWAAKLGRDELLAYQASPRGGVVRVRVRGDRVALAGQAVTVLRATIAPPATHATFASAAPRSNL
jgi:PhzF family phenazine biosynthesis protein